MKPSIFIVTLFFSVDPMFDSFTLCDVLLPQLFNFFHSGKEFAQTIAAHLKWYRESGTNKEDACIKLLEKLELKGVLQLPARRRRSKPRVSRANRISIKKSGTSVHNVLRLRIGVP